MSTGAAIYETVSQIFDPHREGQPAIEALGLAAHLNSDAPAYITDKSKWIPITLTAGPHTAIVRVSQFLAVGASGDPFYLPLQPATLQAVADAKNALLLSKKLVRAFFDTTPAAHRIPLVAPTSWNGTPITVPNGKSVRPPAPDMTTPEAFAAHSKYVNDAIAASGIDLTTSPAAGHSKNVVIGPSLPGQTLAIYGGYGGTVDGWAWQPYPGPHGVSWVDYSQLAQLADRDAVLDGKPIDLRDLFLNPALSLLVSDQGPFDPVFPNKGGPLGPMSVGGGPVQKVLNGGSGGPDAMGAGESSATGRVLLTLGAGLLVAGLLSR